MQRRSSFSWLLLLLLCVYDSEEVQVNKLKATGLVASDSFLYKDGCRAGTIVAGTIDGHLVAFDAWSGKIKWSFDTGGPLISSTSVAAADSNDTPAILKKDESCPEDRYRYIPSLDGRIYSMSKDGELEELKHSARDLVDAGGPLKPHLKHLSDSFLVGEKHTKLFAVELATGNIETIDDFDKSKTTETSSSKVYIGRSEYKSRAIRADNGSLAWSLKVGEYFIHSHHSQCPNIGSYVNEPDEKYPTFESESSRRIVARDRDTGEVLWTWDLPSVIVSMYGLTRTGSIFHQASVAGPSKRVLSPPKAASQAMTMHSRVTDVIIQNFGDQLYILPSAVDTEEYNDLLPRRPLHVSTAGLFVTWRFVGLVACLVFAFAGIIAILCYRRGKRRIVADSDIPFEIGRRVRDAYLTLRGRKPTKIIESPGAKYVSNSAVLFKSGSGVGSDRCRSESYPTFQRSVSLGAFTDHREAPLKRERFRSDLRSFESDTRTSPTGVEEVEEDTPQGQFWASKSSGIADSEEDSWGDLPVHSEGSSVSSCAPSPMVLPYVSAFRFSKEFEEVNVLGKGGFGKVFSARNLLDGRKYAIKRIGLCTTSQKVTLQKVLREVKVLALLDHPNIVRYYQAWLEQMSESDLNEQDMRPDQSLSDMEISELQSYTTGGSVDIEADGFQWERGIEDHTHTLSRKKHLSRNPRRNVKPDHWLYIQMQFCSKRSLADYLKLSRRTGNETDQIIKLFGQICCGLAHVHHCGLIHRDLKPANILVMDEDYENIKLGDFGLSRYVGKSEPLVHAPMEEDCTLDDKTSGVGTYIYASPEQIDGRAYDAKTDMYSLGMVLLEMCHPVFSTQMERYQTLHRARDNKLPSALLNSERPILIEMIHKLLSRNADQRPSAMEVTEWSETLLGRRIPLSRTLMSKDSSETDFMILQVESKGSCSGKSVLLEVTEAIHEAWPAVNISQCGVRMNDGLSVLEFVVNGKYADDPTCLESVILAVKHLPGVVQVRQL